MTWPPAAWMRLLTGKMSRSDMLTCIKLDIRRHGQEHKHKIGRVFIVCMATKNLAAYLQSRIQDEEKLMRCRSYILAKR